MTYPRDYPKSGKECKRHLNTFLTHLRKDYKGVQYIWFMEFQSRGAAHFHVYTSCEIPGETYTNPLWYSIVGSNCPNHKNTGTRVKKIDDEELAIYYALKYAGKQDQKEIPFDFQNVGRFWGTSRRLCDPVMILSNVSTSELESLHQSYSNFTNLDKTTQINTDKMPSYLWNYSSSSHTILINYCKLHFKTLDEDELPKDDCVNYFNKLHTEKLDSYNTMEQPLYKAENHVYIHLSKGGTFKKCVYKGCYDKNDELIVLSEDEKRKLESRSV